MSDGSLEPPAEPRAASTATIAAAGWIVAASLLFLLAPTDAGGSSRLAMLPQLGLTAFIADGLAGLSTQSLTDRVGSLVRAAVVLAAALGFGTGLLRLLDRADADRRRPLAEAAGLAAAIGLAAIGWATFLLGVAGLLRGWSAGLLLLLGVGLLVLALPDWAGRLRAGAQPAVSRWMLAAVGIALLSTVIVATTPSRDFDVREYHLQGPKEWHAAGRIGFLEHNVYTSFPTLAEMQTLLQFTLGGDQIAAKAVSWLHVPLAALLIGGLASRLHPLAGWWAVLIWLTAPWTTIIAEVAYVEGPLCLFTLATLAAAVEADMPRRGLLTGLLAGAASSVKYTGVVYVAVPLGLLLAVRAMRGRISWTTVAAAVAGGAVVLSPWLLKNLIETGNPVYPLAYSIFGGVDLDPEWAGRWKAAHAARVPWSQPASIPGDAARTLWQVVVSSTFQTALLLVLLPLGVWSQWRSPTGRLLAGQVAWIAAVYWLATHRIDRFWLPLLPAAAVLGGAAVASLRAWPSVLARRTATITVAGWTVFHLLMAWSISPASQPLQPIAQQLAEVKKPFLQAVETAVQNTPDARVLLVGEAEVFEAVTPVVYATVFDRSRLQLFAADATGDAVDDAAAIRKRLRAAGITHVAANWPEVIRYRLSYGTTDFDSQHTIAALQAAGVLGAARPLAEAVPLASRSVDEQRELVAIGLGDPSWTPWVLWPVLD